MPVGSVVTRPGLYTTNGPETSNSCGIGVAPGCLFRSKADLTARKSDVRFTPDNGLRADIAPCPFRAMNGLMHLQQTPASFDYFVGPDKRCGLEPHAEFGGYLQV